MLSGSRPVRGSPVGEVRRMVDLYLKRRLGGRGGDWDDDGGEGVKVTSNVWTRGMVFWVPWVFQPRSGRP